MEHNTLSLASLFSALWSRRWAIIMTTTVSIAVAAWLSITAAPTFQATATIVIDYDNAVGEELDAKSTLAAGLQENYLTTQLGIIGSRHVATKVVEQLGLENEQSWKDAFNENTEGIGSAKDWIAGVLLEYLTVTPGKNSRLVNVTYTAQTPEMAAAIANAFATAYQETNLEMNTQPARKEAQQFELLLAELRESLVGAQRHVSEYQREHGIVLTDERMDVETERMKELLAQRVQAEAEARAFESRLQRVEGLKADGESLNALPEVLVNDVIRDMKRQLAAKEAEFAEVRRQLGSNHPRYKSAAAEVSALRAALAGEVDSIASGIKAEAEQARSRADAYVTAENEQQEAVMQLKQARDQLSALVREQENAQQSYDQGLQRFNRFLIQSRLSQTNVAVLNPAVAPSQSSRPNLKRTLILAGLLGLMLGFAYAVIREVLDRRVRSRADLDDISDGVFLGSLPNYRG